MNLSYILLHSSPVLAAIAVFAYFAVAAAVTAHVLLHKDDVKSAIAWIALVFLSPFIGAAIYIFFGINRVRRKGAKLRRKAGILDNFTKQQRAEIYDNLSVQKKQFINFGMNIHGQSFAAGNSVEPLYNGTEAYPAMIEAIKNAKKEALVESYIFDSDSETDKFIEAFKAAAGNGASIKVLIDAIGTLNPFTRSIEAKLKSVKGLQYAVFLPPRIHIALPFVNLRNHRKIIIVDGTTAFFGGMNLSAENTLVTDKKNGVLDVTFKIEGAVIDQLAQVFEDDWEFATGKNMHSCSETAVYGESGKIVARVIPDGPDNKLSKIELLLQCMINEAEKKILIVTPYFLPESGILTALEMAAMKGVHVEIIIPKKTDHILMDWAMEPNFARLLEAGVKIYMTPRPFDHSKICVIDDGWVFIGSANWDVRSFRLNFEAGMEIISAELAGKLTAAAEEKKKNAKRAKIEDSLKLPVLKRLRNNAARLLTPYY
ncbi:MAG: phospholipase D-like domain-containing protein [Endomicrobia bacterium]|nr:phospholipase D-like domain-containing protein [Endomicrobiia bacterium]